MRTSIRLALVATVGATVALAQTGAVQVVGERSAIAGCEALGEVRGSSLMGMILENAGWQASVDEMKERALELGATHLLLREVKNGLTGSNGWGEAYGCKLPPTPPAPARSRRGR